jgi:glycosyltransferase involved in cell wall biosynthesis
LRVLIFHGYLLAGTGSNVYNAKLAEALTRAGHEVHLVCQERHPERLPFVDAIGEWTGGGLQVRTQREPVRCTVYRPDVGPVLPVYVADRYEGIEARPFPDCSDEELALYRERNMDAVREVVQRAAPEAALANHLVMGPQILARALADSGVPYAVTVHGSALEYTVKPHPERFLPMAREGLAPARTVLVGSRHTAESLWAAMGDPELPDRTRLGPPGVDVREFVPRDRAQATAGLRALARRLAAAEGSPAGEDAFARDLHGAAAALGELDPERDRLVAFVGKLILSKGVDLLVAAWPLVLMRVPEARLVVVGFGAYGRSLARLRDALAAGDLAAVRRMAEQGRGLEGGPLGHLRFLLAFVDRLQGRERAQYLEAAAALSDRVVLLGRLEHDELADLLPACEAEVVPSTFPEAFGMVAVEAAACGALPISADHSGLAEVTRVLAASVPVEAAPWLSFALDDHAADAIADQVAAWLEAPVELREATREALVATTRERFSWEGVARGVLAAAQGQLDALDAPLPG